MDEARFWPALEYRVCRELRGVAECARLGMWCDGFVPHGVDLTASQMRISGRVWICFHRSQEPWTFELHLPDSAQDGHIPWSTLLPADATTQWLHVDHERRHLVLVPAEAVPDPA